MGNTLQPREQNWYSSCRLRSQLAQLLCAFVGRGWMRSFRNTTRALLMM